MRSLHLLLIYDDQNIIVKNNSFSMLFYLKSHKPLS